MLLTPKGFLQVGGIVLILVGLLGAMGLIGPTSESIFGTAWYFDGAENWAHLVLGIVGLAAAFVLPANLQKGLVMLLGIVGVLVGLYSLTGAVPEGSTLLGAQLQNPADSLLHLIIGAWALAASLKRREAAPAQMPQM